MRQHADALVSPPCRDCPFSNLPFHPFAAPPMITSELSHFHPALPSRNLTPGEPSNPIGPRPPRQRLPPSLLIENASDPVFRPCHLSCPRRFRSRLATIRQSDEKGVIRTNALRGNKRGRRHLKSSVGARLSIRTLAPLDVRQSSRSQRQPVVRLRIRHENSPVSPAACAHAKSRSARAEGEWKGSLQK